MRSAPQGPLEVFPLACFRSGAMCDGIPSSGPVSRQSEGASVTVSSVAVFAEEFVLCTFLSPRSFALYRNKMMTIPVGTAGGSGPLGICVCWITQNTDAEIMDSVVVSDYSWEGHGLQKGDVITAIQGVPVKNMKKSFLIELCQGPSPINLTITRSDPQEKQDSGASQPATTAWEPFWSALHQRRYWGNRETGESVWELPTLRDSGASQLVTAVSATASVGGQWEPFWSDKHLRLFYYNEATRESVWKLPTSRPSALLATLNQESLIAYERIRRHLGGFGGRGAEHYCSLFGEPHSGTAPFGSRVWRGIRELASRDVQLRNYPLDEMRFGWFQAPQPFSRRNAELPLERDEWWQMPYPAVFVKWNGDLWIVRCLAILLNNGRNWYTHWSRVTFITSDDDVIPPSSGPAPENGLARKCDGALQPAASLASTRTPWGSSTSGSWSSGASCSDPGDDYEIPSDDEYMI